MTIKKWLSSRASGSSPGNKKTTSVEQQRQLQQRLVNLSDSELHHHEEEDIAEREKYPAHEQLEDVSSSAAASPLHRKAGASSSISGAVPGERGLGRQPKRPSLLQLQGRSLMSQEEPMHASPPTSPTPRNNDNDDHENNGEQDGEQQPKRPSLLQERARYLMSREAAFFPSDMTKNDDDNDDDDPRRVFGGVRGVSEASDLRDNRQKLGNTSDSDDADDEVDDHDDARRVFGGLRTRIVELKGEVEKIKSPKSKSKKKKGVKFDPDSIRHKEEIFTTEPRQILTTKGHCVYEDEYNSEEDDFDDFVGLDFDTTSDRMQQRYGSVRFPS